MRKEDIKYIYFEIYSTYIDGVSSIKEIRNENILLLKPNTNSDGIWGFTNITERKYKGRNDSTKVEQFWVDFTKCVTFSSYNGECIEKAMHIIMEKLKQINRTELLTKIIS